MINSNFRICIVAIVVLAALIFLSCEVNPPPDIGLPEETIPEKKNTKDEWVITDAFQFTEGNVPINFFVSPDKKIYAMNKTAILLLSGTEWLKVLSPHQDWWFGLFVAEKDYILFTETNLSCLPRLCYSMIKSENTFHDVSECKTIEIPFSEGIHGLKRINKNKFIVLGLMEYAVLEIINPEKNIYSIQHYGIYEHPGSVINFVKNQFSNEPLFHSVDALFILDKKNNYRKLIKILEFPNPVLTPNNINYYVTNVIDRCFGNSNYGIFNRQERFYFYEKTGESYSIRDYQYLNLSDGDSVDAAGKYFFIIKDSLNVYCLAKGKLCRMIPDDKYKLSNKWEVISHLSEEYFREIVLLNDNEFVTSGKMTYIIKKANKEINIVAESHEPTDYSFFVGGLQTPSSVYGIGVGDFDRDGKDDLYLADILENNIYYNRINSDYPSNEASKRGLEGRKTIVKTITNSPELDLGVVVADIDESGSDDILLTNLDGPNSLYINNGYGYFRYSTHDFALDSVMNRSEGAAIADINNDGWLDIFMTSYNGTNRLFLNDNGVRFEDITEESGLTSSWGAVSAVFGDINNDGLPDLYVCFWMDYNRLYINKGNNKFVDIAPSAGVSCGNLKRSNSALFADFNNDARIDLFVGNRITGNKLFINIGDEKFRDISDPANISGKYITYGAAAADFDFDGYTDLFFTDTSGIHVFKNAGLQQNNYVKFIEQNDVNFFLPFNHSNYNTGLTLVDIGDDNDLDLVMGQNDGRIFYIINTFDTTKPNNFIIVKVIGSESNKSAIGAKLTLYKDSTIVGFREISGGQGYACSGTKTVYFGLGKDTGVFEIKVDFPSGVSKKVSVSAGSVLTVREHEGFDELRFNAYKAIVKFMMGNSLGYNIIKLIILLVFWSMMFYVLKSRIIKKIFPGYIYLNKNQFIKIVIVSVVLYFFSIFLNELYLYFYPDNAAWVNNTRNYFLEDYLPYIISLAPLMIFQFLIKGNPPPGKTTAEIINSLVTKLKGFRHGESSLMCLNRLSLFLKNISSIDFDDIELMNRIEQAITEFKSVTFTEILGISTLCNELSSVEIFSELSLNLKHAARILSQNAEKLNAILSGFQLQISSGTFKTQNVYQALSGIENIRSEVDYLNDVIKQKTSSDLFRIISLVEKKFSDNEKVQIEINPKQRDYNPIVFMPGNELEKILSILVQNSIESYDFSFDLIAKIIIEVELTEFYIIVKVCDSGCGIPETLKERIFQKGFSTKKGGSGFGLPYILETLNSYEGSIEFDSVINEGSSFTIKLKSLP